MKIDPSRLHSIGRSKVGGIRPADVDGVSPVGGTGAASAAGDVDRLALSHRAEEIRAARAALAETPEVRARRVAQLKAQIEAGTYRVDADTVAERILKPRS